MKDRTAIDLKYLRNIKAVTWLQGREYLTHNGLVRVAHEHGLRSLDAEVIHADFEKGAFAVRVVADGDRGRFTGHGDANSKNVAKHLREACLRMAETRAISRALRLYTGLGMTCVDELPSQPNDVTLGESVVAEEADVVDGDFEVVPERPAIQAPPAAATPSTKAFRAPVMVDTSAACAACGTMKTAGAAADRPDLRFCDAHLHAWSQPDDPSFDEVAFGVDLSGLDIEAGSLDLRCIASPQWKKRPRSMTEAERGRLVAVLKEHADRKRAK